MKNFIMRLRNDVYLFVKTMVFLLISGVITVTGINKTQQRSSTEFVDVYERGGGVRERERD